LERKWFRSFVEEQIGARVEAIVAEGLCFVGTYAGNLYALDIRDGRTVWQVQAGGPIGHSPCYHDGRLWVCTDEGFDRGGLLCLDAKSGAQIWRYEAGAGIWNSPACDGQRVYVGDRAGVFHAVNCADGRAAWTHQTGAMILKPASFSPDGRRVVVGSEDMHVYCFSPDGHLHWKSAKLSGLSQRDQAPTVWDGKVVVRTNPAWGFHESLYAGRTLLREIQQQIRLDEADDAVIVDTPTMFFLRRTERRERAEHERIVQFLRDRPDLRTWFTFDLQDGSEPWITSVLFTSGLHNPPSPPAFHPRTNELYTIMPTAIGVYCSGVSQTGIGIGRIDSQTGYLTNLAHAHGDREPGYFAGMPMITDETSTVGLMGDFLTVTHMGAVGGVDLITRKIRHLHGVRDTYGGLFGPGAAPGSWDGSKRLARDGYVQNAVNEWHGPDRSMAAIAQGRAFWVAGGCVVCFAGRDVPPGEGAGDRPPAPWKWSQMPRINGGNVTSSFGQYDATVPKHTITPDRLQPYLQPPPPVAQAASLCPPVDEPSDHPIRQRLESQVSQFLDGQPWAPWIVELGISHEELHFWRTGETMRILATALPYLSPPLRERTGRCLDRLFEQGVPLDRPVFEPNGRRREHYDLSLPLQEARISRPPSSRAGLFDLYALWAYAHYQDRWDRVLPLLPTIRQRFREELNAVPPDDLANIDGETIVRLNRHVAGLIAWTRMLEQVDDKDAASMVRQRLAEWVTSRVHLERAEPRLQTQIGHHARIARYEDLVPELACVLAGFAGESLERNANDLDRELRVWYHAWGERLIGGENYINPPALSRGLYAVMADGLRHPPVRLRRHLDQPWCQADLYYLEKLISTLRGGEEMGLALSGNGETPGKSAVAKVPVPTFFTASQGHVEDQREYAAQAEQNWGCPIFLRVALTR
jgi:hypothetical protein